ncbi:DUF2975 domain-containing protein [Oleiagrimonas sp. C23AA]|uniref:DUF2975 domain-containing protein n=1 Tax=Oleiagrimonas sp. C23AA TaxID=2719047 RepID=UPI001424A3C5|nr:DUF2975 domain-containing protein [Oleiagrimonas sp. C23AA]NII11708.1 DUF2975 domain-containing protein [Oleiagrimonas sp. C23AA]
MGTTHTPLQRHGHRLMSLASLALFVTFMSWLLAMAAQVAPSGQLHTWFEPIGVSLPRHQAPLTMTQGLALAISTLLCTAAMMWPWWELRRLGRGLWQGDVISARLARVVRRLAHALVGASVVRMVVTPSVAGLFGAQVNVRLDSGLFLLVTIAIVAYAMAAIMQHAVAVQAENHEFV